MSHVDEGQLHAYLDGELEFTEPAGRERLEAHVADCAACAALLAEAERIHGRAAGILDDRGKDAGEVPPFEAITDRATGRARRAAMRRMQTLGLAASIVLAVAVGWYAQQSAAPSPAFELDAVSDIESADDRLALQAPARDDAAPQPDAAPGAGPETRPSTAPLAPPEPSRPEPVTVVAARRRTPPADTAAGDAAGRGAGAPAAQAPQEPVILAEERRELERAAVDAAQERVAARRIDSVARRRGVMAQVAAGLADRDAAPGWITSNRAAAQVRLGAAPLAVPDLPISEIAVGGGASEMVRVVQALPGGEALELYQWRTGTDVSAVLTRQEDEAGNVVQRGELTVLGRANVPTDSLRALLARLREAPNAN